MIPWLEPGAPFPPVNHALDRPNGLLAASVSLSPEQLIAAYRLGIFPWYSEGDPVMWWCPNPRMVLLTAQFHVSRSLRKTLRAVARDPARELRFDYDFAAVMRCCAAPRQGQDGTWISEEIIGAYCELAKRDLAHSVELWHQGQLIGGLYGVSLGRMFYGESMFSGVRDGSKIALATLVAILSREQVPVIDCQQRTLHLASLGAREVPRRDFCEHVARSVAQPPINWSVYRGVRLNRFLEKY
ncbi:MAG TPA: leucyl/phenylalanyl-tRNA--protein transferase [Burkholderiaceae bacterium]|nr:leucyl/phenylalanyl-tRNA--protein transferase [Burkholderiaceae bacterium]